MQPLQGIHGGPDAQGVPLHDFSTNANACGPCPGALAALQAADPSVYPDPGYTLLRAKLARVHGVEATRIVLAASASEFIHRITTLAQLRGARSVAVPAHGYGDYEQAAAARSLAPLRPAHAAWAQAGLQWACEPASPLGTADAALAQWRQPGAQAGVGGALRVIDCAYAPLQLQGPAWPERAALPDLAWQLWTPNKALGLTGVRAAYAVAPRQVTGGDLAALAALAPSWPVGAHGVALLSAWAGPEAQQWLATCLPVLRHWKQAQQALCAALGWQVQPGSLANYFVAQLPVDDVPDTLVRLRSHGIKLRDCASFGLPGLVRLAILAPPAQQALQRAWLAVRYKRHAVAPGVEMPEHPGKSRLSPTENTP